MVATTVLVALARGQPAAVDPHHDWTEIFVRALPVVLVQPRRKNVQEQTVLADAGAAALGAYVAERRRVEQPIPSPKRLRRRPAQIADRRLGVGNAKEFGDAVRDETLDRSFFRFDDRAQLLLGRLILRGGHARP